ncbi:MAG: 30S ribosome-binding factor RbfA [Clostridia bacterium]|nr:30S ribosome-binding factor RbfA [Clostridia bacterium]
MGKSYKPERMGEEIRKGISDMLIRGDLKDPGFKSSMISVNAADVTNDGSYATVYITSLEYGNASGSTPERKKEILKAFEKSKGHIRTALGKKIKARHIPELIFKFDESFEYGAKMDALIDSLDIPEDIPGEEEEDFND